MKKIGIWLDKKSAFIVTLNGNAPVVDIIESELEFYHPKGGSRSKTRWGPQEVVQDSRYLEREKHQLKKYFQMVIEKASNADALVIFGPGSTGQKLQKEISIHHPDLAARIAQVEKADSMSDNQKIAWVRNYFD
ncbi:MAG: hypothetical protein KJN76_09815 [Eudoraea sp.]|nr:hypothetical protein [Eudoraea sp.]